VVQTGVGLNGTAAADLYAAGSVLVCPTSRARFGRDMQRTYAINATGRPMWLSCSWPCYVGGCGGGPARVDPKVFEVLQEKCNTWRDFNDMYDNQDSLYNIINHMYTMKCR
jgi:hypothetical protein